MDVQAHVHPEAGTDRVGVIGAVVASALAFAFWTTSGRARAPRQRAPTPGSQFPAIRQMGSTPEAASP